MRGERLVEAVPSEDSLIQDSKKDWKLLKCAITWVVLNFLVALIFLMAISS